MSKKEITMHEEMLHMKPLEERQSLLHQALLKAQKEIETASKKTKAYKYNYADLKEVIECSRPALHKHGLLVLQPIVVRDGQTMLETIISHKDGGEVRSQIPIPAHDGNPQGMGSYITYMRRYTYASFLGIITEDDDGKAAQKTQSAYERSPRSMEVPPQRINVAEAKQIEREIGDDVTLLRGLLSYHKISAIHELPKSEFEGCIAKLRTRQRNKEMVTA